MTSIIAGLTKRDEELEEKAKEWESEKQKEEVQEEGVPPPVVLNFIRTFLFPL